LGQDGALRQGEVDLGARSGHLDSPDVLEEARFELAGLDPIPRNVRFGSALLATTRGADLVP